MQASQPFCSCSLSKLCRDSLRVGTSFFLRHSQSDGVTEQLVTFSLREHFSLGREFQRGRDSNLCSHAQQSCTLSSLGHLAAPSAFIFFSYTRFFRTTTCVRRRSRVVITIYTLDFFDASCKHPILSVPVLLASSVEIP